MLRSKRYEIHFATTDSQLCQHAQNSSYKEKE